MLMDGATSSMPISIHAPRVGSDLLRRLELGGARISIHAPRVGSDKIPCEILLRYQEFLSTLPAWGATLPEL